MMTTNELGKRVQQMVAERLGALCFKHKQGIFTLQIEPYVKCWIGLNKAPLKNIGFEVNVVGGIRHDGVERLVSELTEEPYQPLTPPTIAGHIGYLYQPRSHAVQGFRGKGSPNGGPHLTRRPHDTAGRDLEALPKPENKEK
jgi:hypothetical protein